MSEPLQLYVKTWCPWCVAAHEWLDEHGYQYETLDVESDPAIMEELVELTGRRKCPTLTVGDLVLPDFGPEELEVFLKKHSIAP